MISLILVRRQDIDMVTRGIGGHHSPQSKSNDWITPPHVLQALGDFDLDPCESLTQPWPCARNGFTIVDDGLIQMFRHSIWQQADAILFLTGRLTFHRPNGEKAKGNSGGPSVLIAYGTHNIECLRTCGLPGALIVNWETQGL